MMKTLDKHITRWREQPVTVRSIEVIDALQRLRLDIVGELLPSVEGDYLHRNIYSQKLSRYKDHNELVSLLGTLEDI